MAIYRLCYYLNQRKCTFFVSSQDLQRHFKSSQFASFQFHRKGITLCFFLLFPKLPENTEKCHCYALKDDTTLQNCVHPQIAFHPFEQNCVIVRIKGDVSSSQKGSFKSWTMRAYIARLRFSLRARQSQIRARAARGGAGWAPASNSPSRRGAHRHRRERFPRHLSLGILHCRRAGGTSTDQIHPQIRVRFCARSAPAAAVIPANWIGTGRRLEARGAKIIHF